MTDVAAGCVSLAFISKENRPRFLELEKFGKSRTFRAGKKPVAFAAVPGGKKLRRTQEQAVPHLPVAVATGVPCAHLPRIWRMCCTGSPARLCAKRWSRGGGALLRRSLGKSHQLGRQKLKVLPVTVPLFQERISPAKKETGCRRRRVASVVMTVRSSALRLFTAS